MKAYQKCISRIQASVAAGQMSAAQAQQILTFVHQQIQQIGAQRAANLSAKASAALNAGVHNIPAIVQNAANYQAQLTKRAHLMNIRAYRDMIKFVMDDPKRMPGKGVELFFQRAKHAIKGNVDEFSNALLTRFEAHGLDLESFSSMTRQDRLDMINEIKNLSMKQPVAGGVTGNARARKIAEAYMSTNDEALAFANRNGGFVDRAEGRTFLQTHDTNKIRKAGIEGFFEKADMGKSYTAWKDFVTSLNIDWNRMGIASVAEREKFLRGMHTNLYTLNFSKEGNLDSVMRDGGIASLASKQAVERKLWFADAESELAYHERFGSGDTVLEQMSAQLASTARTGTLMAYFGPNADANVKGALAFITERNKHLPDSVKRLDSMSKSANMWEEVTGRTSISTRPNLSAMVDKAKELSLLAKGGSMVFTTVPDMVNLATSMTYRGVSAMDAAATHVIALLPKGPTGKDALRQFENVIHAYLRNGASSYLSDIGRDGWTSKSVDKMFKWTGFTWINNFVKRAAGETYGLELGHHAGKDFGDLAPEIQRDLSLYGIDKEEWDVWRKYKQPFEDSRGTHDFLSPESVDKFTDTELDSILAKRGDTATPVNRDRLRDRLRSDSMALFHDVIEDAATGPTIRGSAIMHQGAMRGGLGREFGELFFHLKSYGINSMLRTIERERSRTGTTSLNEWRKHEGISAKWQLLGHAVGMGLAGYLTVILSDLRKGQTPSPFIVDWQPQWDTVFNSIQRGGGWGIMGDFLFNEYDKRYRSFSDAALGPVLGEVSNIADIATNVKSALLPDEENERYASAKAAGYGMTKFIRNNMPLANFFVTKPILDHLFWYQMSEGFSPGIAEKQAKYLEKRGKSYWNEYQDPRNATDPIGIRDWTERRLDSSK